MAMREQIDVALEAYCCGMPPTWEERTSFTAGFLAALDRIANPSDEMVERVARMLASWGLDADFTPDYARACLAAAVGDTTNDR